MRSSLAIAIACVSFAGTTFAADSWTEARRPTNIVAQDLGAALQALAKERGFQIAYGDELSKLKTKGASGELTSVEALAQLLRGTGFTYVILNEGGVSIVPMERGSRREGLDPDRDIMEVVVTGTHLRKQGEPTSMLTTISRSDIDRNGGATVLEVISRLSQASVTNDESGAMSAGASSTIQLRGMPTGTTLLLINGHRVSASPAVAGLYNDPSMIPAAAVERIEIISGTASAIYGSDAMAGAVNIILRDSLDGIAADLRYGDSSEGGAAERRASLSYGGSAGAVSWMLIGDAFHRDPLLGSERALTSDSDYRRFGGLDRRSTSSYPGNVYSLDGTALPGLTSTRAGIPSSAAGTVLTPADFAATDGVLNRESVISAYPLLTQTNRNTLLATGKLSLDSGAIVSAQVLLGENEVFMPAAPDSLFSGSVGYFTVPATNPFNPFGEAVGVDYRFNELGNREDHYETKYTRALLAGDNIRLGRFDVSVSGLWDRSRVNTQLDNYIDYALVRQYLNSSDPAVALNVFSTSPNNPATLAAIRSHRTIEGETKSMQGTAVARTEFALAEAVSLPMAFGVEHRTEDLEYYGVVADRAVTSGFAELALELGSTRLGAPLVELNTAARYDDHDDFGSSFTYRFGASWYPWDRVRLHSNYGTAFRAPSLYYLFAPRLTQTTTAVDPARGGEVISVMGTSGGNPYLDAEKGTSFDLGVTLDLPAINGAVSVNAFRVSIDNTVQFFSSATLLENESLFAERIVRAAPTPADVALGYPGRILSMDTTRVNFGELTSEGLDFQATAGAKLFSDSLNGSLIVNGTYVDKYESALIPGATATSRAGRANLSGFAPRMRASATAMLGHISGLSGSLTYRYVSSSIDYAGTGRLGPYQWLDGQITWTKADGLGPLLSREFKVTLGATNLTNEIGGYSNNTSIAPYDLLQADMRGRFWYVNLSLGM
ncbi:TonB-dependent receptor [Peristeroidobacter soli]|uniref:TonB-dependent receptor n=1 Tax=Peristeroidobacter soli TaxID=2497877 RepID=UPI0015888DEC|nr:TonB-dependent receptor [Peristeroidobacter soli]